MPEVAAATLRGSLVLFARSCEAADAVEKVTADHGRRLSSAQITDETVFADFAIHGSSLTIFLVRVMVRREFLNLSKRGIFADLIIFGESACVRCSPEDLRFFGVVGFRSSVSPIANHQPPFLTDDGQTINDGTD
jgi:hypothetical protein